MTAPDPRDALREALEVLRDFTYPQGPAPTAAEVEVDAALTVIEAAIAGAATPPALDVERRLFEAVRRVIRDGIDSHGTYEELHAAFYAARLTREETPPPCVHCNGRRWVNDENWTPDYPREWDGKRYPGDGLIPCGDCNFAGWDTPEETP